MTNSNTLSIDKNELKQNVLSLLKEQFGLKMQLSTQQSNNTAQLKKLRKDIARLKTKINSKESK